MLKRIGAEESGEFKAIASGTLPSGKPVIINADGTVSVVSETSATQALGSATVFESASVVGDIGIAYDTSNDKIVIAYEDVGNSSKGTAIVGTVSGTSISFGTPVIFNDASTSQTNIVFDSSNNKMVISYMNQGSTDNGTAIVGTVSGTSISFGTAVEFETSDADSQASVFDSTNNKVVIVYRDGNNSNRGTAVVGTVSGTSISFGSTVQFDTENFQDPAMAFDSANGKVVVTFHTTATGDNSYAIVGTVSGTSISFGTRSLVNANTGSGKNIAYDENTGKIVIVYRDNGNSDYGTAIVGTISDTSISFGSEVVFNSANSQHMWATYHPLSKKIFITYKDVGNSNRGMAIEGTVSGTSISFGSETEFETGETIFTTSVYDPDEKVIVIAYVDQGNSNYGTSLVFKAAYTSTTLTSENYIGMSKGGAVADTKGATVDIIGSVNDEQSSLTSGQQYFVQTDGTISETEDDPSVLAGTAISATKLIVKG
jgi:hypothetical protein